MNHGVVVGESNRLSKEEVVVFGLDSEILEDGVGPEPLHVVLLSAS